MKVINIYSDPTGLLTSDSSIILFENVDQYPLLYRTIREMLNGTRERKEIFINNNQLIAWIKMMNYFEPNHLIQINEVAIKSIIEQSWGISAPAYLSEEELLTIYKNYPGLKIKENFEDDLIYHILGVSLNNTFSFKEAINITSNLNLEKYFECLGNETLKKIITRKVNSILESNTKIRKLITLFFKNPVEFKRTIIKYRVLKNYSLELKHRFLNEYIAELESIELNTIHFTNHDFSSIEKNIHGAIKIELNMIINNVLSADEYFELVKITSGVLEEEFELLLSLLTKFNSLEKEDILSRVVKHFSILLEERSDLIAKIERLRSPNYPSSPEALNEIDQWIRWSITEYLPYRFWLDSQNMFDEKINYFGSLFAEWIASNYLEIKLTYPKTLLKLIPNIKIEIDKQSFTVLLVIDNLSIRFVDHIIKLFKSNNFSVRSMDTYLAMIPTETKISKTALLSSNTTFSKREQDYRKLAESSISEYFNDKIISYVTKVSDPGSFASEADFIIVNFLMIDEFMHADQNKMAKDRSECIIDELQSLVNKLMLQLKDKPEVDIYIVSDHGSTRLPSNDYLIDNDILETKYQDRKERVITVSDSELVRSRQWFEKIGFIFKRDIYDLDTNYIVAKGYKSFKRLVTDSYVHGGLTPEEMLVPFVHLRRSTLTVNRPNIFLLNNSFRYNVKSKLSLIIENMNDEMLEQVQIRIMSHFVSAEPQTLQIEFINGWTKEEISFENIRLLRKGSNSPTQIDMLLNYKYGETIYHEEVSLPIEIKSIQENTFDFDL